MKIVMTENSSILMVSGFQIDTYIGVYDFEKQRKQKVVIDLEIEIVNQDSFYTDEISDAIDYVEVINSISKLVSSKHFNLVEHLAEKVSQLILNNWPVKTVKINVGKVGVCSNAEFVGVKIKRSATNFSICSSTTDKVLLKKTPNPRELA